MEPEIFLMNCPMSCWWSPKYLISSTECLSLKNYYQSCSYICNASSQRLLLVECMQSTTEHNVDRDLMFFPQVMRTFGWSPTEEELKDLVNVIDQVSLSSTLHLPSFHKVRNNAIGKYSQTKVLLDSGKGLEC